MNADATCPLNRKDASASSVNRSKPLKFASASSLPLCAVTTVASSRMQATPSRNRSAIRTGGSVPACPHARRRALFTAAVTLRRPRSPPAAASFSARHAVGTDATGPKTSRWSPITRKSLITRAPSAIAHARSASTRPRSWPPSGDGSAADRPAVSPVRSASSRSSTSPACDTTPVPPYVTSRPRDHPVAFTWKVLLELERIRA